MSEILSKELVSQSTAFNVLSRFVDIRGKRVLEVGGNSDCVAATPFANADAALVLVTGLYHVDSATETPHSVIALDEADALKLDEKYSAGSFDLIYGISILEHIPNPAAFFAQVSHTLSEGGLAFLQGSPLWTGPWGHHIHLTPWQNGTSGVYQFIPSQLLLDQGVNTFNPIPDWGHLLQTREEMMVHLMSQRIPHQDFEPILSYVYDGDVLNREPVSSIIEAANASDLKIVEMEYDRVTLPAETMDRLRVRYPESLDDYSIMGVRIVLRKG